jgi:hypothetical protein
MRALSRLHPRYTLKAPLAHKPLQARSNILHSQTSPMPFALLSSLFGTSPSSSNTMAFPVKKTEEEWRAVLSPGKIRRAPTPPRATTDPRRAVPHPPPAGHRGAALGPPRRALRAAGRLRLRRVRRAPLPRLAQVPQRLRLAGLLRRRARGRPAPARRRLRHGAHRDRVRELRRPPGPRVQGGGVPNADGRAALRQQREHSVRREGRGGGGRGRGQDRRGEGRDGKGLGPRVPVHILHLTRNELMFSWSQSGI